MTENMDSAAAKSSRATKKNPTASLIWSLVFCGGGQFYNGETSLGVAFLLAGFLGMILFWPLWFGVAIYSMYRAERSAQKINSEIDLKEQASRSEEAAAEEIRTTTTKAADFVSQLEKLDNLRKNDLLNDTEYKNKVSQLIATLAHKKPLESADDFLTALIPLVKSEALNAENVANIKAVLEEVKTVVSQRSRVRVW